MVELKINIIDFTAQRLYVNIFLFKLLIKWFVKNVLGMNIKMITIQCGPKIPDNFQNKSTMVELHLILL